MSDEVDYATVHGMLVDAAARFDLSTLPVRVHVKCGIGARKACGRPLGDLLASEAGATIWRPAVTFDGPPATTACGRLSFVLPTSSTDQREGFCEYLMTACTKGHPWNLSVGELQDQFRTARRGKPTAYYVRRDVPTEWGPRLNNPKNWTPVEAAEAFDALEMLAAGKWPPPDMPLIRRRQVEARMRALAKRVGELPDE